VRLLPSSHDAFRRFAKYRTSAMSDGGERQLLTPFKALSCDIRLRIVGWLSDPEGNFPENAPPDTSVGVCVSHIQQKAGLSPSTTSAHLAVLQRAGLVRSTRIGQWTYYARDEEAIAALADAIQTDLLRSG